MIKPDGVQVDRAAAGSIHKMLMFSQYALIKPPTNPCSSQRGLVGEIISRFERRGFQLRALKSINVERSLAEKHYSDLSAKPFFKDLVRLGGHNMSGVPNCSCCR